MKLSQKGILAKIALHKHFAIANGSTLWLQVLSRVFLPSYTQNTTLFSELSEKKCCLVRAAMLGLVFTGACLVYYVRSLSSLTPTGKKINCLSDLLKKRKIRGFSLASRAREKYIFLDFYKGSPRAKLKKSSHARASRAQNFVFLYAKTCRVFRTNLAFLS